MIEASVFTVKVASGSTEITTSSREVVVVAKNASGAIVAAKSLFTEDTVRVVGLEETAALAYVCNDVSGVA